MTRRLISGWALLAIAVTAGCMDPHSSLLSKHMSNKRKEEAKEHWDSVRGGVKLQLARQNLQAGRLDEAEKILVQSVSLSPNDPQAFLLLGKLRLEQGQLAEARQAITAAATLSPGNPEISYLAGVIAQRYGDLEMAAEHYTAAAERAPNVVDYVLAQAETLVALDRTIDALELVELRIKDFDTSAPMQMLAARVCRSVGLRQPAVDHCREALQLAPDDRLTAADCGQIFGWAARYPDAINTLKPLLQAVPTGSKGPGAKVGDLISVAHSIRRCLASAYLAQGNAAEALACIQPVLEGSDTDPASLMLCAHAALNVEDSKTAARALTMLHRNSAETSETLLLDGYLAFLNADYQKALDSADRAAKLDGRLVPAHCLKGRSAQALGKLDVAELAFAAAVAIDPNAPIAAALIANLSSPPRCTGGDSFQSITPQKTRESEKRFTP